MKGKNDDIPRYRLSNFRPVHRHENIPSKFGYNQIDKSKVIEGFELYSSEGLISSIGPLMSEFYRMSITVCGTLNMTIGLEEYKHQPRTVSFTFPNQIFSKKNISKDASGYYLLFTHDFLNDIIPSLKIADEFPFYNISGTQVFQLDEGEMNNIVALVLKMNNELQQHVTGRAKAVKMYLYLVLLEAKRSYERQQFNSNNNSNDSYDLITRFRKLVSQHYLSSRQVADYAGMLAVSPNHLNRAVKEATAKTASQTIKEMLLQEAKSLLRYTGNSISEIAYKLDFSDPASFNRFFKKMAQETPLEYRRNN